MARVTIFFILLILKESLATINTQCYELSGAATNQYFPCSLQNENSFCCQNGFICLATANYGGLCQVGPNAKNMGATDYYKARCTDPYFKDPACPSYCPDDSGVGMQTCPELGTGKMCCWQGDRDCCQDSTLVFDLGLSSIVNTIDSAAILSQIATMPAPPTSTTTRAMKTSQASSATFTNVSSSPGVPSSTSIMSTSTAVATAANSTSQPASFRGSTSSRSGSAYPAVATEPVAAGGNSGKSSSIPLGIGVGLGLFAGLAAIAGVMFYFLRQRRTSETQSYTERLAYENNKTELSAMSSTRSYQSFSESELAAGRDHMRSELPTKGVAVYATELPTKHTSA